MIRITIACLLTFSALAASACGSIRTSTDPSTVILAYFEALGTGDVDGAQALVADDATFDILGNVLTGKIEIQEYNQEAVLGNPSYELSNIQIEGNRVAYTNRVTLGSRIFNLASEAVVQDGKIVSIIDR